MRTCVNVSCLPCAVFLTAPCPGAELCRVEEPAWLKRSSTPRGKVPTSGAGQITSSYGVGPTDDSGVPLFGLRALRKQRTEPAPGELPDFLPNPNLPVLLTSD